MQLATEQGEHAATKAELAAALAELSAAREEIAALKAAGAKPEAGTKPEATQANATVDPAAPVVCELDELSFLSPRGKFSVRLTADCLTLTGKGATVVVPLATLRGAWLLPDPAIKGILFAATLTAPAANGKSSIGCVTLASKPSDKPRAVQLGAAVGGGCVSAAPAEALARAIAAATGARPYPAHSSIPAPPPDRTLPV